ncbi:MAG TPA: 1-acyl-sn-glycerol-3-phosphate acyltransferase [Candidatus Avoscillospira avicola]|uniref:1-acyl-sn-glycerol-3-phosphate acyltransferase n=1 Tax=Candidatus Avoscillospira avicola TaxID=2840706 RepID=A0A9D1DI20_9FIRM|nr:1-acyl-sn-glycerol-3-phosphate acyltransferase [Candidatus Avoscillospira avicola]
MIHGAIYCFLFVACRIGLFFYHPVFRVVGREHIPKDGRLLICANHSGLADPIWIIMALRMGHMPRVMAKKEAFDVPILGWFLRSIGVFGIDRDGMDISGIKTGIRCLRDEQQLLLFPEGTRVKPGRQVKAKRGAVLLAQKTDTPILPVYLTVKRRPFSKLTCVIGEPYRPTFANKRPSEEELEQATDDLMGTIYRLGENT